MLQAINTYTYGGVGKNMKQSMDQKHYRKNRIGTLAAENRFSQESINTGAEAFFVRESIHTPKKISDILP